MMQILRVERTRGGPRPAPAAALAALALLVLAPRAFAQDPARDGEASSLAPLKFLGGAAVALGVHEAGHLLFDVAFDAEPRLKRVEFAGVPFFAITHRAGMSPRREYAIAAAGFWVQHLENEWLLGQRPAIPTRSAPFAKGVFAFNLGTSVAYSGAAFFRVGPVERDTRAMAESRRLAEPWVGALILAPAALDAYRYFHPDSAWAAWSSRLLKAGLVLLVMR